MVMDEVQTQGGEHTTQCTDDVFQNCASETCIILLTSVTPHKFNKMQKKQMYVCL